MFKTLYFLYKSKHYILVKGTSSIGPTPFFYTLEIFVNEILCFGYLLDSLAILTLTGTFLSYPNLNGYFPKLS